MYNFKTVFLVALLFAQSSFSARLSSSLHQIPSNTIYVTADNILDSITINDKIVDLKGVSGIEDWTQTSTINVPFDINEGDKIQISATNSGKWNKSNPASIIATIYYKNRKGDILKLNTNSFWTCDDKAPLVHGNNGVSPWGLRPNIDASAQHIWNSDEQKPNSTCSIVIPESNNGVIYVTVDNVITDITVGGKKVDINASNGINDWTVTKSYDISINDGDIISISGENSGQYSNSNPGSIIASIIYYNKNGEKVILNTGDDWSCDDSSPQVFGNNGVGPWGIRPNIDPLAKHIWNSDASVPKSTCTKRSVVKKNAKLFVTVDNIISSISIAGVEVDLEKSSGIDDWKKTKSYDVDFKEGDIISITGVNSGAYNTSNPGSILATLRYSLNGIDKEINTNEKWLCNKKTASLLGNNGVAPWGDFPLISSTASHIWSKDLTEATVTCTLNEPIVIFDVYPPEVEDDCDE